MSSTAMARSAPPATAEGGRVGKRATCRGELQGEDVRRTRQAAGAQRQAVALLEGVLRRQVGRVGVTRPPWSTAMPHPSSSAVPPKNVLLTMPPVGLSFVTNASLRGAVWQRRPRIFDCAARRV